MKEDAIWLYNCEKSISRIELSLLNYLFKPVPSSTRRTVVYVGNGVEIYMFWDNCRTPSIEPNQDGFRKLHRM